MRTATVLLYAGLLLLPAALAAQDDDDGDRHPRDHGRCACGLREVEDDAGRARRRGFWASVGLGVGGESFDAKDGLGWSDDKSGGVIDLKLGGTVSPSILLGVEAQAWTADFPSQRYRRNLLSLMGIAQWYPARTAGFWVRGGVGFARDELDYGVGQPTIHQDGTALALGFGYDIPVGRSVSITPSLDLLGHRYDTHDERVITAGLAVTFP